MFSTHCPICGMPGVLDLNYKPVIGFDPNLCRFFCENNFPHEYFVVSKYHATKRDRLQSKSTGEKDLDHTHLLLGLR